MKATAQMGGLTRQEIEYLTAQFALLAARAEWKPKSIDRIRAFGDLALRAIDHWVPVSERLPEAGQEYWIKLPTGEQIKAYFHDGDWNMTGALSGTGWIVQRNARYPTHWKPLPPPPERP